MKENKTNAMRILDKEKISYRTITYECDEFTDGLHTAALINEPVEKIYKTLVTVGKSKNYYVFVIPVAKELNLKLAAAQAGEKSVEMIHVRDINQVTGYIRGGCTAIGMKKQYKTFIDSSAAELKSMIVSGGRIGMQMELVPADLCKAAHAQFALLAE